MLSVESDHRQATTVLQELARLCAAHGAQWHSELKAELHEGSMRLLAPPGFSGELITMPTKLLVPIKATKWNSSDDQLILEQFPTTLSSIQVELLDLHIALYNATGKMQWFSNSHPARLLEISSAVAEAVGRVKQGQIIKPHHSSRAEGFLGTRSFNYRISPDETSMPVLMPLIDLLNHHPEGAPYRIGDGVMRIQAAQTGDSECFAHYGSRRDVLDLALHYGYCDLNTPFAHCAQLEIHVDGIGSISVQHQGRRKPIHPLDPPRIQISRDGIKISHLCSSLNHPERATTMLLMALKGCLQKRGHSREAASELAERGLSAVVEENLNRLSELKYAASQADHPGSTVITEASIRQSWIIEKMLN